MYSKTFKRKSPIRHIAVYAVMTLAVLIIVTLITMFMLGFRFDGNDLQQNAFLQFSTSPSGATVSIDGNVIGSKTPNKSQVAAGRHEVIMWRDGYDTWTKSVDLTSGTLTWLNYALLVPKKLVIESVASYDSVYLSVASPKGNDMLIQKRSDTPVFDLVDLSSDSIKSTVLTIPVSVYSKSTNPVSANEFRIDKWDDSGRYVLVNHKFDDKDEWLVMDTQNASLTKNITQLFDLPISNIVFSGTSGNILYSLDSNDIRKFDLSASTISRPLVSNVSSFEIYNESKVITYVGTGKAETSERVVGIYRDGDDSPSVIRTVTTASDVALGIATSRYFNENYVAVLDGNKVDIYSGSYPNTTSDNANNMKIITSFNVAEKINKLSFSPAGGYVFVQSGAYFASYDLEYRMFKSSTIEGNGDIRSIEWLDDNYIWSDRDGKLTIREFDGANSHIINPVVVGQDATLTSNGRYLYSINKTDTVYRLQRVRMILP